MWRRRHRPPGRTTPPRKAGETHRRGTLEASAPPRGRADTFYRDDLEFDGRLFASVQQGEGESVHINWDAVSAISSVTGTVLVIGAAWIALRQFKESSSTRQVQSIMGLIDQFQSSSARSMRAFLNSRRTEILSFLSESDGLAKLDAYLQQHGPPSNGPASVTEVRHNVAVLEFIAVLSLSNNISSELERAYLAPVITSYWEAVRPIVGLIRLNPGDELYLQHLESLAQLIACGDLYRRGLTRAKQQRLRIIIQNGQ